MSRFVKVATVDQIPPGDRKLIFFEDRPVALLNIEGEFFCIADVCTHDGGTLAEGELFGYELECPRHGALFDVRTGEALTLPATEPTSSYRVRVRGDDILIGPSAESK